MMQIECDTQDKTHVPLIVVLTVRWDGVMGFTSDACPPSQQGERGYEMDKKKATQPASEQTLFMPPFLQETRRLRLQSARNYICVLFNFIYCQANACVCGADAGS